MNKKLFSLMTVSALALAACNAGGGGSSSSSEEKRADSTAQVSKISIGISPYEFGPAVNKLVFALDQEATAVDSSKALVKTADVKRKITKAYLSDEKGNAVKDGKASKYATVELEVGFVEDKSSTPASPFRFDMKTFRNFWQDSYQVDVTGLSATVGGESVDLTKSEDAIGNKIITSTEPFKVRETVSGNYVNPLTQVTEKVTLNYAAYQPDHLKDGAKNPLVIWLHGAGEGGTDIDLALLGNEVTALIGDEVQSQFTATDAADEKGAYVLAVQTPTVWMDEGDGTNGAGAGDSRYREALKAAIDQYVASNPDIDTSRIYLSGCSNGGYMTINMAINYPDYFAALVPSAAAYAYYNYQRNDDGTYAKEENPETGMPMHIREDTVFFDQAKVDTLKNIPTWFIHSADDTTVLPENYALPIYKALVDSGAENAWFSYYETVQGKDMPNTQYIGHWSWIYYFNDSVSGVQDVSAIREAEGVTGFKPSDGNYGGSATVTVDGQTYKSVFSWLNAQHK